MVCNYRILPLIPPLKTGLTFAIFHADGYRPQLYDWLNILVKVPLMWGAAIFKYLAEMLSAPVALLGFIVFRAIYTSESNKGLN